jgi:hypothetical protein
MPFYLYKREEQKKRENFKQLEQVSIAGRHNAIYKIWEKKDKPPINDGWHITADELIKEINYQDRNSNQIRFIIDYAPSDGRRMTLVELSDIYIYTYGGKTRSKVEVHWSILMLRLRDVFSPEHEWFGHEITHEEKNKKNQEFWIPKQEETKENHFFEFLYLQNNWQWGKVGNVNAAFIKQESWEFFKKFFSF